MEAAAPLIGLALGLFAGGVAQGRLCQTAICGPLLGLLVGYVLGWCKVRFKAGS